MQLEQKITDALNLEKFEQFILENPDLMFYKFDACKCPIGKYLNTVCNNDQIAVGVWDIGYLENDQECAIDLPEDFQEIRRLVDHSGYAANTVNSQQVLSYISLVKGI